MTFAALLAGTLARWREAVAVAGIIVLLAVAVSLIMPPSYLAYSSFVTTDAPVELPRGLSDLAAQSGLSGLASQLGVGSARDPSQSPAFYTRLLNSRELLTRLALSRFADPRTPEPGDSATLVQVFRIRSPDSLRALELAVRRLRGTVRVITDPRTTFVTLRVRSRWPELAAAVANRAVELVGAFNREQRLTRVQARRAFLETRVAAAAEELRQTETALGAFHQANRLWRESPSLVIEEQRLRRQAETAGSLYLSLRQQYETARIDEVNTTPVITVVDRAVPPRLRDSPRRKLMVITAGMLGAILGLLWAAGHELLTTWAQRNPTDAGLLRLTAARVAGEVRGTLPSRRRAAT